MIAVFWAQWQDFRREASLLTWGAAGAVFAVAFLAGSFQPVYPAFVLPTLFFLLGWTLGTQEWSSRKSWNWVVDEGTKPQAYLAGKALGLVLIGASTLLFLSPLIVLALAVSGVSGSALLWTLAWSLIVGLWSLGVACLLTQGPRNFWSFLGVALLVLALVETSAIPELRWASPLMQLWSLYQTGDGNPGLWSLGAHLLALTGLYSVTVLVYRLNPRYH